MWKLWYDDYPIGCQPHREDPYAFKILALQRAITAGFRYILWMDTSFQPVASIENVWQSIEKDGWYIPRQGDALLGTWSTDEALQIYRDLAR